jgi:hypothetical protein
MKLAGIATIFVGFLIAVTSLGTTPSTGGRLVMVLVGITVSLVGLFGVLNRAYVKNAIWKR